MNRSVKYGLAVTGMAGGIFFLGQAAADASTSLTNTNTGGQVATVDDGHGSPENTSINVQANIADQSTKIVSAPEQTTGDATNSVTVTLPAGAPAKVIVEDVKVSQTAETGKIVGGNQTVAELPTPAAVSLSNVNNVPQSATTKSDEEKKPPTHPNNNNNNSLAALTSSTPMGGGGQGSGAENVSFNGQLNLYDGSTTIISRPEQTTGDATNTVNFDFSNATFYCGDSQMNLTSQEQKKCEYLIKVEGITITQNAKTGDIIGGNQVIGTPAKPEEHKAPEQKAVAAAPVKAATPVVHKAAAAVLSNAQPVKALAFTGAETSLPLTLGLLALGAGGALTLAGRRRETTTV